MNRLLTGALRLAFPRKAMCMGCGDMTGCREEWICPACRQRLTELYLGAAPPLPGLDGMAFACAYVRPATRLIQRMKYGELYGLAEFMAGEMASAFAGLQPTGAEAIVYVPMYPARERARGYNHARKLAEALSLRLNLPVLDALERVRDTPQQARLNDQARRENVRGAFSLKAPVEGRRLILVDDVCTTGATAQGCAGVLRAGGAKAVYLAGYARAMAPDEGRKAK